MGPLWRHVGERSLKRGVGLIHEILIDHQNHVFELPNLSRDTRRNRWRGFERPVLGAKIG